LLRFGCAGFKPSSSFPAAKNARPSMPLRVFFFVDTGHRGRIRGPGERGTLSLFHPPPFFFFLSFRFHSLCHLSGALLSNLTKQSEGAIDFLELLRCVAGASPPPFRVNRQILADSVVPPFFCSILVVSLLRLEPKPTASPLRTHCSFCLQREPRLFLATHRFFEWTFFLFQVPFSLTVVPSHFYSPPSSFRINFPSPPLSSSWSPDGPRTPQTPRGG